MINLPDCPMRIHLPSRGKLSQTSDSGQGNPNCFNTGSQPVFTPLQSPLHGLITVPDIEHFGTYKEQRSSFNAGEHPYCKSGANVLRARSASLCVLWEKLFGNLVLL